MYCEVRRKQEEIEFGLKVHGRLQRLQNSDIVLFLLPVITVTFQAETEYNPLSGFLYKFHLGLAVLILFATPLLPLISF